MQGVFSNANDIHHFGLGIIFCFDEYNYHDSLQVGMSHTVVEGIGHHEHSPAMVKVCSLASCLWCPVIVRHCVCYRFSEKNPSSMDMTTMIKLVLPTYCMMFPLFLVKVLSSSVSVMCRR